MTGKKYKLIESELAESIYRIKALRDIPEYGVEKGDLGGHIQWEKNLSHEGNSWVSPQACVSENAVVRDNAYISGGATISGNALVMDNALVTGDSRVKGDVIISDNSCVRGKAVVAGHSRVRDNALVSGNSYVSEYALVTGDSHIGDCALVCGDSYIKGNAIIGGNAHINGDVVVHGNAHINGDSYIEKQMHMMTTKVIASNEFDATLTRTLTGNHLKVDCWSGTLEEFEEMIHSDKWVEANPKEIEESREEMLAFIELCKARMKRW